MSKRARLPGRLFQPILGKLLGVMVLGNVGFALAQDSTFSTTVGMAVLCLDDVEPGFFFNYLNNVKPPYKREQGAYWFKVTGAFFGAPVSEVFVSDGSSRYSFVGMVSSLAPVELAAAIAVGAPAGGNFRSSDPADKYSIFVSPAGSQIVYQGKKGKIFCRRDRIQQQD
jgi:hypothetical protein